MNLHNLSENEFDAKVKGRLEDASVPFDQASWKKMSQKLDREFPGSGSDNSGIIGLMLLLLLLSGLFFWKVTSFPQNILSIRLQETNLNVKHSDTKLAIAEETGASKLGERSDNINNGTNNLPQEGNNKSPEQQENISNSKSPEHQDNVNTNNLQQEGNNKGIEQQENISNNKSPEQQDNINHGKKGSIQQQDDISNSKKSSTLPEGNSIQQQDIQAVSTMYYRSFGNKVAYGSSLAMLAKSNITGLDGVDLPSVPDSVELLVLSNIEELPLIIEPSSSPWFIGFGYAPDFSLVGSSELTKPGTNLSLMVEYRINQRWSIQSGIIYSTKNYIADGEDYHPPKGFWDYGVVPDMTYGTCEVLDIPINIRYYFSPAKHNRLFVSNGLSTYLMLKEDYDYQYESGNPLLIQSWSGENENQHYFAIYNLSFGYQRSIKRQWFFEIEPFIKLPLTGIGFGAVDLWSTGISFSLKHNFK